MAVKVYGPTMSTNVVRVLVCLEEVGVEYEVVPIDFSEREQKGPEHLTRNYVLRKYKTDEADLLRDGNLEESALVDVWLDVEAHQFNPAISPIIFQHFVVPIRGGVANQKIIDESVEKLKKTLEVYEARLSKSRYLAGDYTSLADLSLFPYTYYFMATPYASSLLESCPGVMAWWEGMVARPAVQKVIAQLPKAST